jgi:hypothetical protein
MFRRTALCLLLLACASWSLGQAAPGGFRISGKAVNAVNGQVLAGTEVSISKAEQPNSAVQKMLTANDGKFSFAGLEPGKYVLAAERTGYSRQGFEQHGAFLSAVVVGRGLVSENLIFRLRPDGRIAGTIVDEQNEPVANATLWLFRSDASAGFKHIYQRATTSPDDRGYYHFAHIEAGRYYLVLTAQPWFGQYLQASLNGDNQPATNNADLDVAFPVTFYPGVSDSASATQIVLDEGQDFTADFTLSAVPAVHLRLNNFNNTPEEPKNANLMLKVFGSELPLPGQRVIPTNENAFEIGGIAPGRYQLDIHTYGTMREEHSTIVNLTGDADFSADAALAAPTLSGTIQMEKGDLNLDPQALVLLWNTHSNETLTTQIQDKGQFEFGPSLLPPGNYSVFVVNGMNSIISNLSATGAQVDGQTIHVTASSPIQMKVVLSSNLSTINGTARRDGAPFAGAMIVLVPENPEKNLPLFRRDQSDSDGTFTLHDVLPGKYKILAIQDGWDVEWADMGLFKTRLDRASSIEIQSSKTYDETVKVE